MTLYRATYHGPREPDGSSYYETRILPTRRAVELWAQACLQGVRVETTRDCYWRDVARAPSVTYQELRETAKSRGEILPEIIIVPSVGELGYW